MMAEHKCPHCGKPVAENALMGLCPDCLLKAGVPGASGTSAGDTTPFEPPTVTELAPRFPQLEIVELLGRGGMGAVYKARQKHLDRLVALKILPPGIGQDPSFAERFTREAQALARLAHPNIVTLYEFGQADGLFYFLMEFVDGVDLRQLLDAGKLAPKEALAIVPQICDALQFAHNRGIVHRDIKPANILLSKDGQVKITDFGVAKIVARPTAEGPAFGAPEPSSGLTGAGLAIGTPAYMAPEQVSHPQDVDHRADIYSLGVVFYQMLTGELPAGKFTPPSRKVQIDVRLDEVVLHALEQEPERRYQQASEVKTDVETIAESRQAKGVPATSPRNASWAAKIVLVGRRAGQAVIYWPNVLVCFLAILAVAEAGAILASLILMGGIDERGVGLAFLGAMVAIGIMIRRGLTTPVEQLTGLKASDGKEGSPMGATTQEQGATGQPRLSRTAVVGSIWAPFFFVALFLLVFVKFAFRAEGSHPSPRPFDWSMLLTVPLFLWGVTAPFGTTILGWVAVAQIRRSARRIYGLGLALFDGLLFPLLALDALIIGLSIVACVFGVRLVASGYTELPPIQLEERLSQLRTNTMLFVVLTGLVAGVIAAAVDYWIVRRAWRAVNKPLGTAPPPADAAVLPSTPPRISPQPGKSKPVGGLRTALLTTAYHAVLLLLFLLFIGFFVSRFEQSFKELGMALPLVTQLEISLANFVRHYCFLLIPVLIGLDAGVCFLLQHFGGRRWRYWYSAGVTVALGLVVALMVAALLAPSRGSAEASRPSPQIQHFPRGTVELVAISRHPSDGQSWWCPDGTPAEEGPFRTEENHRSASVTYRAREFVFRTQGLPEDASYPVWQFAPPPATIHVCNALDATGQPAKGCRLLCASLPVSTRALNIKFGVAMGPWETIKQSSEGARGYGDEVARSLAARTNNWRVSFLESVEKADRSTVVSVTYAKVDWQTRLVAIDDQGQEHAPPPTRISRHGSTGDLTTTFTNLPVSRIKEFRFEARPYHWVEFRNVALEPNRAAEARANALEPGALPASSAVSGEKVFVVTGRVVNNRGQPMAGVEVRAAWGKFTLLPTGTAVTDAGGNYTLRFGPGVWGQTTAENPEGVGFQAATISVHQDGWFETNLCRQGKLAMTDQPGPWAKAQDFAGVIQPGVPQTLDFVMSPAASLKGVLRGEKGQPVAAMLLWLGASELPPSSGVLRSASTDTTGRFEFRDLPVGRQFWVGLRPGSGKQDLTSAPFILSEVGTYSLSVTLKPGALQLEGPTRENGAPPGQNRAQLKPGVDPEVFTVELDRVQMQGAVSLLREKYARRVCIEDLDKDLVKDRVSVKVALAQFEVEAGRRTLSSKEQRLLELARQWRREGKSEDAAFDMAQHYTGRFTAQTFDRLLDAATQDTPYAWRRIGDTYVVYPRERSLLDYSVSLNTEALTVEQAVQEILLTKPQGARIGLMQNYVGPVRPGADPMPWLKTQLPKLPVENVTAMEALCLVTERADPDLVWHIQGFQGQRHLSLLRSETAMLKAKAEANDLKSDGTSFESKMSGDRKGAFDPWIGRYKFAQDSNYAGKPLDITRDEQGFSILLEGRKAALEREGDHFRFTTGDMVWNKDQTSKELEWGYIFRDPDRQQLYMGSPHNPQWRQYLETR